jgi:lipopolysaccharide export system protein LptA
MTRTGVCVLLLLGSFAGAQMQVDELRLPISLDAESTDYDGKNSMLLFRGLRLTQGSIGVVADIGRASQLDFEQATWQFSGNVRIDVEGGHIECDAADLEFNNHVLTLATIEGSPATFEMRRPNSEEVTYAEAEQLRYNLADGVVTFAGNAKITEGGNQIASNSLVYNIVERRINAQSTGDGEDRVKITYTPPPAGDAEDGPTADSAAPENQDTTGNEEPESP